MAARQLSVKQLIRLAISLLLLIVISAFAANEQQPHERLWNLRNADINAVVEAVSTETGKNFIIDPRVQGKLTIVSSTPINADQLYQVFLSGLQVLGAAAVPAGDVIKLVPNTSAREMLSSSTDKQAQGDALMVRVVPIQHVSATQLVPILRPLLPSWASINAYQPSNSIILAGTAGNVDHLISIIHRVDQANNNDIEIIPLEHGSAARLVNVLTGLLNADRNQGKVTNVSLAADEQSNSILLSGDENSRLRMRVLISQLDTTSAENNNSNTDVVYLNYLQAKDLAPLLAQVANASYEQLANGDSTGATVAVANALSTGTATAQPIGASMPNKALTSAPLPNAGSAPNNYVSVQAEPNTNAIIIHAPPTIMRMLKQVIEQVDLRPSQVLVEAIIAEVDESVANRLGIAWGYNPPTQAGNVSFTDSSNSMSGFHSGIGIISNGNLQLLVNALTTDNRADILSTPSIMVMDNQEASIKVGTNITVVNREYGGGNSSNTSTSTLPYNTFESKDVALELNVTPQISPDNTVRLGIQLNNDTLKNPDNPTTTPIINISSINNTVMVNSNDILVLGGLISQSDLDEVTKVPFLGDIPLLGNAFRSKSKSREKKNLMVFIKPIIVNNDRTNWQLTRDKYNHIRDQQVVHYMGGRLIQPGDNTPVLPAHDPVQQIELPAPFSDQ